MINPLQKQSPQTIALLIITVLFLLSLFWPSLFSWFNGGSGYTRQDAIIEEQKQTIDSLKGIMELNQALLTQSHERTQLYADSVVTLNKKINQNNAKIATIRKQYDEKIKSLINLNSNDIESYFSNRYGH